ncbi:MAG: Holliday junction resolvase RuvX [Clostridiales bacterium]|jgi:putative Holliday junction resolvase|nr:Holliday junction resolvase RuvX [Clostridiales bacterium]
MRTLCIDYGDKRFGFALGDPTGTIATAYEVYKRKGGAADIERIKQIAAEKEVDTVVLGLPVNMDGAEGPRAELARQFGETIKTALPDIKLVYFDERLSTVTAEEILIEAGVRRDERRNLVDKVAAQIILQGYLDKNKALNKDKR